MNYEEKYNEILEWARKNKARLNGVPIEEVLPELAESEDERIRRKMIEHFRSKTKETWCNIPVKDIIAYLEKQKEQKPAEWSEEDKKKIIFLERLIEHNVPDGQYGWVDGMKGGFVTKSEAISMLKSLRPSWKPSEEQMKALNEIVNILAASPFLHQNDYLFNILNGLREELKKLL